MQIREVFMKKETDTMLAAYDVGSFSGAIVKLIKIKIWA